MDKEQAEQTAETAPEPVKGVQIPQSIRNLHGKALAALERNNTEIAIEILLKCVEQCPEFSAARRNLRLTEIANFKARNGHKSIGHRLFPLTSIPQRMKVKALVKTGRLPEALVAAERLLMRDPLDLQAARTFAEVAIQAGFVEDGLMTMEIVKEHLPSNNLAVLETLGKLYFAVKQYRKARECFEKVHRGRPNDSVITRLLKDSEALSTLDSGWEAAGQSGDYRNVLKDKDEVVKLEQESKMVKSSDDADALIADALQKIAADPKNVNYYLNLTSLYTQQKRYDEAMGVIDQARELVGADPELDRRYSTARIAKYNVEITALRDVGEDAQADEKEGERNQFVFDDIAERVSRYPNDQHLRYELGLQYYTYGHLDEAIQQLQIAQKNPKDRVSALYHLALCFRQKGLLDMAVAQLEQALEFLPSMNAEKMDIYYLLGEISLEEEKLDDAAKYFKEIYRVDVTYRDIGKHIEKIYAAQKQAKESK